MKINKQWIVKNVHHKIVKNVIIITFALNAETPT